MTLKIRVDDNSDHHYKVKFEPADIVDGPNEVEIAPGDSTDITNDLKIRNLKVTIKSMYRPQPRTEKWVVQRHHREVGFSQYYTNTTDNWATADQTAWWTQSNDPTTAKKFDTKQEASDRLIQLANLGLLNADTYVYDVVIRKVKP